MGNMCCFATIGNDLTVAFAAEGGQLELNVMEPVIIYKLFTSVRVLSRGMNTLRERCVTGITANEEHCKQMVHNSIGIVTALLPHIGYKNCTARRSRSTSSPRTCAAPRPRGAGPPETQPRSRFSPRRCRPSLLSLALLHPRSPQRCSVACCP